ncbi:MAG: glycosyltransferase [Acidimicrobiia bacterium]
MGLNILFSTIPGAGHLYPNVPLATALRDAGHEIRIATSPSFADVVAGTGFEMVPVGLDWTQRNVREVLDMEDQPTHDAMMKMFWDVGPRAVYESLTQLDWPVDVIVLDPDERGARLWGEVNGIPWVNVLNYIRGGPLFGAALPHDVAERPEVLAKGPMAAENAIRNDLGLGPVPLLYGESMLDRYLTLDMAPAGITPWEPQLRAATAHPMRPVPHAAEVDADWVERLDPDKDIVHVGFGSLFSYHSDAYPKVVEGLASEGVQLVISAPDGIDVGDPPDDAIVESWVPHQTLLPRCRIFIHHGGWGSTIAGLSHGVPSIVIPHGADQPNNARVVEAFGAGLYLHLSSLAPDKVREAAHALLTEGVYPLNAERIARNIAAMPSPAEVVPLIERLAAEREPIINPDRTESG